MYAHSLRGVRRVEADDDGADRHDRPVEQDPLEARPRERRRRRRRGGRRGRGAPARARRPARRPPATRPRASRPPAPRGRRASPACAHVRQSEGAVRARAGARLARRRSRGRHDHIVERRDAVGEARILGPSRIRRPCARSGTDRSASASSTSRSGSPSRPSGTTCRFRTLHRECGTPIKQKRWCPHHEREVEPDELVKGWEVAKGEFVIVEESDLESVALQRSQSIEILRFVKLEDVDPVYFDRTYYLAPAAADAQRRAVRAAAPRDAGDGHGGGRQVRALGQGEPLPDPRAGRHARDGDCSSSPTTFARRTRSRRRSRRRRCRTPSSASPSR